MKSYGNLTHHWLLGLEVLLMGLSEGKIISKNYEIWLKLKNLFYIGSLEFPLGSYPLRQSFSYWRAQSNKIQIQNRYCGLEVLWFKSFFWYNIAKQTEYRLKNWSYRSPLGGYFPKKNQKKNESYFQMHISKRFSNQISKVNTSFWSK